MILALEILLVILICGSIVFYLACAFCTHRFFAPRERIGQEASTKEEPGVSIMVPLCGLEPGAWENWSSLCQQNYSNYEVLFGAVEATDPAVPVVEKLAVEFGDRVRLFTHLKPRGINHKDSTLSYLLQESHHEIVIFVDSDIRVSPDYISTVTAPLRDPQVGIVTCAFVGRDPQSLGAAIASLGRCVDFIPSLLLSQIVDGGLRCAVGTTIATRKTTLADYGGLHFNRIGSDYNIGKRAAQAGYRVELSPYILESDTGKESVGVVLRRELRWARTIRFNRGPQYYTMVFCYGTIYCIPLLLLAGFANWAIALSLVTWLLRLVQVLIALKGTNAPKLLRLLWGLPLRDFLNLLIWAIGGFGRVVFWRGRRLKIEGDGIICEIPRGEKEAER